MTEYSIDQGAVELYGRMFLSEYAGLEDSPSEEYRYGAACVTVLQEVILTDTFKEWLRNWLMGEDEGDA